MIDSLEIDSELRQEKGEGVRRLRRRASRTPPNFCKMYEPSSTFTNLYDQVPRVLATDWLCTLFRIPSGRYIEVTLYTTGQT